MRALPAHLAQLARLWQELSPAERQSALDEGLPEAGLGQEKRTEAEVEADSIHNLVRNMLLRGPDPALTLECLLRTELSDLSEHRASLKYEETLLTLVAPLLLTPPMARRFLCEQACLRCRTCQSSCRHFLVGLYARGAFDEAVAALEQLWRFCVYRCFLCGKKEDKPGAFRKCGQCRKLRYCSRECQESHWFREHKGSCAPA